MMFAATVRLGSLPHLTEAWQINRKYGFVLDRKISTVTIGILKKQHLLTGVKHWSSYSVIAGGAGSRAPN